jgi:hypothetical protein
MKIIGKIAAVVAFTFIALSLVGLTGCSTPTQERAGTQTKLYYCAMHPDVVQDKPGKCPQCGMDLVEKR